MKENTIKQIFFKISKKLGFEIIDQNNFVSSSLDKELNLNLLNIEKLIILSLCEVKLTKKIKYNRYYEKI
tara:strand:- start:429 stop:638 length:210 start_codon:yes stop_codon:yes gene_type:complete